MTYKSASGGRTPMTLVSLFHSHRYKVVKTNYLEQPSGITGASSTLLPMIITVWESDSAIEPSGLENVHTLIPIVHLDVKR